VCNSVDNCPEDGNGGQADADGDGLGDACDPCTNGAIAAKGRLTLSRLAPPPGDEKLRMSGELSLPFPFTPAINPVTKGARVLIYDVERARVLDAIVPGGPYDPNTRSGWTASGHGWSYRSRGAIDGITKIQLKKSPSNPSLIKFIVKGKDGNYSAQTGRIPLLGTLVIDSPTATTGQCGDVVFLGSPGPSCTSNTTAIKCR